MTGGDNKGSGEEKRKTFHALKVRSKLWLIAFGSLGGGRDYTDADAVLICFNLDTPRGNSQETLNEVDN